MNSVYVRGEFPLSSKLKLLRDYSDDQLRRIGWNPDQLKHAVMQAGLQLPKRPLEQKST